MGAKPPNPLFPPNRGLTKTHKGPPAPKNPEAGSRPHQTLHQVQPPHHRPAAQWGFRPVYEHHDEPALLRPDWSHEGNLVLRATAPRGPQAVHQDGPAPVRGVRRLPQVVVQAEGERTGLEGAG